MNHEQSTCNLVVLAMGLLDTVLVQLQCLVDSMAMVQPSSDGYEDTLDHHIAGYVPMKDTIHVFHTWQGCYVERYMHLPSCKFL